MGGLGSGKRPGDGLGLTYWTAKKERAYQWHLAEEARRKAERSAALEEARRIRGNERKRRVAKERRAANRVARAAGQPIPFPKVRRGGKDKPGASSPRWRRFIERRRRLLADWAAAIREDRRRTKRIARGLPPMPPTSNDRARATRERQKVAHALRLVSNWWSEALPESQIRDLILAQHPWMKDDELRLYTTTASFLAQCRHEGVNPNRFTLGTADSDGIAAAVTSRAIFYECWEEVMARPERVELPYILTVLKQSESVARLEDMAAIATHKDNSSWQVNVIRNHLDSAKTFWGNGAQIFEAVKNERWGASQYLRKGLRKADS